MQVLVVYDLYSLTDPSSNIVDSSAILLALSTTSNMNRNNNNQKASKIQAEILVPILKDLLKTNRIELKGTAY